LRLLLSPTLRGKIPTTNCHYFLTWTSHRSRCCRCCSHDKLPLLHDVDVVPEPLLSLLLPWLPWLLEEVRLLLSLDNARHEVC